MLLLHKLKSLTNSSLGPTPGLSGPCCTLKSLRAHTRARDEVRHALHLHSNECMLLAAIVPAREVDDITVLCQLKVDVESQNFARSLQRACPELLGSVAS